MEMSADTDTPEPCNKPATDTLQNGHLLKPVKPGNDVVRFTDSSSSSSSSSSSDESLPHPPDGGYGWVVVAASFVAHMIADGCSSSIGIFFENVLDEYGQSKSSSAWVGSLLVSMPAICGPIASIATNRFGCRRTTIAGGIIAAIGCILASFANSVAMLCLTFGVITGIGLSLVFVPAVVMVAFYFEKKRALATGIAVSGSGIGAFVFAPLIELLFETYGLDGALIVIGGIMLNLVICGYLYRPLESFKMQRQRRRYLRSLERFSRVSSRRTSGEALDHASTCEHDMENGDGKAVCEMCADVEMISHSLILFPTYLNSEHFSEDIMSPELLNHVRHGSQSLMNLSSTAMVSLIDEKPTVHIYRPSVTQCSDCSPITQTTNTVVAVPDEVETQPPKILKHAKREHSEKRVQKFPEHFMPRYRRDIFYRGSLLKAGALLSGNHSASCPDIFVHSRRRKQSGGVCFHLRGYFRGVLPLLRDSIDLSIFKSLIFILFCIHSMFLYLSYDIPYMYLPAHAEMIGVVSGWASFLISIIGIASTVGQIVMGYIGDRPAVDRVLFYIAMTFTAGAATLFVPLLSSYGTLAIYSAVYGFFISANFALTTIIVVELLGMDQLTNAYGFVSLAEGLANLVGLPLAGWLTDSVGGSYNPSFFASGAIICCSALMLLFVPCLRRCDHIATVNDKSDGSESTSYDAAMMLSDGKPVEANDHTSSSNHTTDFL